MWFPSISPIMPTRTQMGNRDLLKIDLPMSDFLLTSNMSCNKKLDVQIITYCTRTVYYVGG